MFWYGLKLWRSFEGDLGNQLLWDIERVILPINSIIVFNWIEDVLLLNEFIVCEYPTTEHKVLS